jgi:hypothetical protein
MNQQLADHKTACVLWCAVYTEKQGVSVTQHWPRSFAVPKPWLVCLMRVLPTWPARVCQPNPKAS